MNEELKIIVKTEVDKAVRNMKKFQGETDKAGTSSKKFGKTLSDVKVSSLAVAGAVGGAIAVFKKVADTAQVWINAASDAEEISSKFAVTFDEMSVSAESAARELADSYGLAESTAKDLLSATGDMLSGFGATDAQALDLSTRVQKLAVDLASFTNYSGGAKGAADALTKGLLGEREMMKSLGIAIQEADVKQRLLEKGQQDLEGTALKMARAEATLELAYEQSANAIGDYERTQDSYANVARRSEEVTKALREEFGKRLIPAAGTLQGKILEVKESLLELVTATNQLTDAQEKLAKGLELNFTDAAAIANEEVITLQNNLLGLSQGNISISSLRDLVKTIRGGKEGVEETGEEYLRNQRIMENMEMISKRNEKLAANQAELARDKADEEERARQALKDQQDIIDGKYKDAWSEVQAILDDNKTEVEKIQERIDYLANYPWPSDSFYEKARQEAIKILEVQQNIERQLEEGVIPQAEIAAERWEAWANTNDRLNETLTITKDTLLPGIGMAIKQTKEVAEELNPIFNTMASKLGNVFAVMGEGLVDSEKGWIDVGKTAIKAIASVIRGLAEQAAIQAAMAYAQLNVPVGVAWTAASVAGFIAAGVVDGLAGEIGSAAIGADFVTNGPQMLMVGDNPGGRERVSVTPMSSPNVAGPSGGVTIILQSPVYGVDDFYKKMSFVGGQLARRGRL